MSLTTTARTLIRRSLVLTGVVGEGETPSAAQEQDAFATLREIVDGWNTLPLTVLNQTRTVYNLTASQQTYTIGPAALSPDWSTGTQPRPTRLENAMLLLNTSDPAVEIPLGFLTDDAYQAIQIKELENPLPTQIYYNPTDPLGTVFLWPNPTDATNDIVLYTNQFFQQFADLTTLYTLPPGYLRALRYQLAVELAPEYGRQVDPVVASRAEQAIRDVKVENAVMADLPTDPALVPRMGGNWNIFVGP